jgi:hypothetical protein
MPAPQVIVDKNAYHITLFRDGAEKVFSFFGATLMIGRTDDVDTEALLGDDGYVYFLQAFHPDGTSTEIDIDSEEAEEVAELIFEEAGEDIRDY